MDGSLDPAPPSAPGVVLRPEKPADESFLVNLYRSTREDEIRRAGLDPVQARPFLDSQFSLQRHHYRTHYAEGGAFLIVERAGRRIGRLYLHRRGGEIRVVDISLLPRWRSRGLGRGLLAAVQEMAAANDCRVILHVDPANRAIALYRRLGFDVVDNSGASWRLEWRPAQPLPPRPA